MLLIKEQADIDIDYNFEKSLKKNNIIYFDIETTGFSRKYNFVYLIGCMYYENDELFFTQYMAENQKEEAVILQEFFKKISGYDTIIHFNGTAFDMPFLEERGAKYNINFHFSEFKSMDLYKQIKPYKEMLKLENLKQKSIEKLLQIKRCDPFNGGELIEIYNEYIHSKDERLLKALLLHNMEDVFYMGKITSVLNFTDFMNGSFTVNDYSFADYSDWNGNPLRELQIKLSLKSRLPFSFSYQKDMIYISGSENNVFLSVKEITSEMKYFFQNYKDYYYLPEEDTAMHKSIASFVDKNHRKNATASTCYVKKTGSYLPIFYCSTLDFGELFRTEYKDKQNFISSDKINDTTILLYTKILLKNL